MYITLILSYVDPVGIVDQKVIRIESQSGEPRVGTLKEYIPDAFGDNIDLCEVQYDHDPKLNTTTVNENNIRFVGTSRGFVTLLLHGVYKKVPLHELYRYEYFKD